MNGMNGKYESPEVALVPYPIILAATKGDPEAMKLVVQHFSGYIASLSMRKLYDERGNAYYGVDEDILRRGRGHPRKAASQTDEDSPQI